MTRKGWSDVALQDAPECRSGILTSEAKEALKEPHNSGISNRFHNRKSTHQVQESKNDP